MPTRKKETTPEPGFEQAMERLEDIVRRLEGGKLTLDETTALYEEGVKLAALCRGKLDVSRRKVMMLVQENTILNEVSFDETDE